MSIDFSSKTPANLQLQSSQVGHLLFVVHVLMMNDPNFQLS